METVLELYEKYDAHVIKLGIVVVISLIAQWASRILKKRLIRSSEKRSLPKDRLDTLNKLANTFVLVLWILAVSNVLGFGIQGIFIATSSFFAIAGIALFATWSILSNLTSSLILYFAFPFRVGDSIEFSDDDTPSGELVEMTLFYLKIQTAENHIVSVPSNVAIQKIVKTKRHKPSLA